MAIFVRPGASITLHSNAAALPDLRDGARGIFSSSPAGGSILPPAGAERPRRYVLRVRRFTADITTITGPARLLLFSDPGWDGSREANGAPRNRDGSAPNGFEWYDAGQLLTELGLPDLPVPFSRPVDIDPRAVRAAIMGTPAHNVDVFFEPILDS